MEKTKHHRRCVSRGGDESPDNISIVSRTDHEAWHTLFNHMDAESICRRLNGVWIDPYFEYYCKNKKNEHAPIFCEQEIPNQVPRNSNEVKHYRKSVSRGGHENIENISFVTQNELNAWHTLFKDYDMDAICQIINDVWLDPRYQFFIRVRLNGHVHQSCELELKHREEQLSHS